MFLLGGCVVGLDPALFLGVNRDTGSSDGEVSVTDQDEPTNTEQATERRDIWIYTGHGGAAVATPSGLGGIESVQAHWNTEGWDTSVISELPDVREMDQPKLLVLAAPGSRSQVRFEPLDVRKIEQFLESDGLLAVYVDACTNPHINTLLSNLGMGIQLSADSEQASAVVRDADIDDASTIVTGIDSLALFEPCRLTVQSGTSLVFRDLASGNEVYVASGRPDVGGEAIALGDFQLIDDAGYFEEADNKAFASRLAARSPATVR